MCMAARTPSGQTACVRLWPASSPLGWQVSSQVDQCVCWVQMIWFVTCCDYLSFGGGLDPPSMCLLSTSVHHEQLHLRHA